MIINSKIKTDAISNKEVEETKDSHPLVLEKFFQFILVNDYYPHKEPNVHIYTSMVSSSNDWKKKSPRVELTVDIAQEEKREPVDVTREFFKDIESLKLFWGKNSTKIRHNEEIDRHLKKIWGKIYDDEKTKERRYSDQRLKEKSGSIQNLRRRLEKDQIDVLLINEPHQFIVTPFFLIPQQTLPGEGSSIRVGADDAIASVLDGIDNDFVAVGSWVRSSFEIDFRSEQPRHRTSYFLEWERGLRCKDFSLYFALPPGSQVQYQRGYIHYLSETENEPTESAVETFGVYTQHENPYFRDWIDKAIRDCSLVRLSISSRVRKSMVDGSTTSLDVEIGSVDEHAIFSQRRRVLLQNIWFAAVFSLGFSFDRKLQLWGTEIGGDLVWLLMSLCVLPTFFYRERYNSAPFIIFTRWSCWMLYFLWVFSDILADGLTSTIFGFDFHQYLPNNSKFLFLIVCASGLFVSIYQHRKYLINCWRSFSERCANFFGSR